MLVGERLRAARKEREMSLADLARATKLSKGFISQVESGISNPSLASLRKLTAALGLKPGEPLDETSSSMRVQRAEPSLQTTQSVDRDGIRVHSSSITGHSTSRGIVHVLSGAQQGQAAIFTLAPHETIHSSSITDGSSGLALCAILEGTVRIGRPSVMAIATQGQVASFYAGRPYELTNPSSNRAIFLLTLPAGVELPRRMDVAHRINRLSSASSAAGSSAGPFRIVEMRAGRNERGR